MTDFSDRADAHLTPDGRLRREVTSYVRRSTRMTPSQTKNWQTFGPQYLVPLPDLPPTGLVRPGSQLNLDELFGRSADLIVEIGPGKGESLVPLAAQHPDINFLAFEVYQAAAAAIVHKASVAHLSNLKIALADAASGLEHLLAPAEISEVWTFFPDPWHKARHHKRRLITAEFVELVSSRLRVGGRWRLATDWAEYAEVMLATIGDNPYFRNEYKDSEESHGFAPRWVGRTLTRFEERGAKAGRASHDLSYLRVAP